VNKQLNELKRIQTNRWMKLRRLSRIWKRKQIKIWKPWKIINLK
jgi:hypothetical protein